VVGSYVDAAFRAHGFLRLPAGTITSFDPTGSIQTVACSIDSETSIAGYYVDSAGVQHGFLRTHE